MLSLALSRRYGHLARLLALAVPVLCLAAAPPAWAQDEADDSVAKVTQLNRQAIDAYQAHKVDDAQKLLRQALSLCDSSGLEQHPITARTHIHLGMVLIGGAKQRAAGIAELKKALAIQPDIGLTKSLATPDMQKAFDEAKSGAGAAPAPGGDLPEAPTPPPAAAAATPKETPPAGGDEGEAAVPSTGLTHDPVTQGRSSSAIPIIVNVDSSLKFEKIVLAYRASGAGDFFGREMKQVETGVYSAEIPARATTGGDVVYYIEAQDKDGEPISAIGSADKPLTIKLGQQAVAAAKQRSDNDEGDEDDDEDDDDEGDHEDGGSKFFVGLQVGSGIGYTTGNGDRDVRTQYADGTIAVAQAGHFAPEVGYRLRPDLMVSVQIRYQYITGTTDYYGDTGRAHHTYNYALAGFAKASWLFGHGGRLRPFVALALGGGYIRHVVALDSPRDCGPTGMHVSCIDTVSGGPILGGAGVGLIYGLSDHMGVMVSANALVGFPSFTANLDGNIGATFSF